MLAVKGGYGLLPQSVKTAFRKNLALRAWYGKQLQQSGLFYGFPSQKKLFALYKDCLKKQQADLAVLPADTRNYAVVVLGSNKDALRLTLSSLGQLQERLLHIYVSNEVLPALQSLAAEIKPLSDLAQQPHKWLLCLRAGEQINPNALKALPDVVEPRLFYFDWHYLDNKDKPVDAQLLPAWNPDYQLSAGYVKTALVIHQPEQLVDLSLLSSGINDYTCMLARMAINHAQPVEHVPYSLLAAGQNAQHDKADIDALADVVEPVAIPVKDKKQGILNLMWPLPTTPLVSLIIPTYNGMDLVKACIESILEKTTYQNYEILLVDNNSNDAQCLAYFDELDKHPKIRLLKYPYPFNYSAINNFAAGHARGEVIGLVNNDIEVITPQWLEYMAGHAMRDDIGCVGAKLLYTDGRIQHAGVVMGYGGGAGHAHKYFPRYHSGYMNRLIATQNYSAVTAACLLVKKSIFDEVGGLNEEDLQVAFNDVDFCLRVLETGVRNVYCAEAELFHHESVSRGLDITEEKAARFNRELTYLRTTWKKYIANDPAYNPNLTLKRENFAIKAKEEY
ncbi:glycosyltransferase family 2 protein [Salinimonas lutimaris]|uniref:glycosyltransferase family 2 protein n=1 Tax=Salinimonas lutimaris TaxID=914153 RepID=UPI0010C08644